MNRHLREQSEHALIETVEQSSRRGEWPVYENYDFISDGAGNSYVCAPRPNRVKKILNPLSRVSADLFLRFAGWVKECDMDKELGTPNNAEAAKAWAEAYGVLGLNPPDMDLLGLVNSQRITADYLGLPWRGTVVVGRRNTAHGGRPNESVENFAFEAWEAHIVLGLYESVRSQEDTDVPSVIRFMSTFDRGELPGSSWVEKDLYSQDSELVRWWALSIVEGAVNRKIGSYCYPTIQGAPSSYEQGWGFKSLLGAMWLQMMFLMRADRQCWWCGKPIDPGRRSHARFCDNNGRCRQHWNYHAGEGESSKGKKQQTRYLNYRDGLTPP